MVNKRGPGRPSCYSADLASVICERIALGESLRAICRETEMPNLSTVLEWVRSKQEFSVQYARARECQAELFATEIVAIADAATDSNEAQVAKVRIDARKWFASKVAPKKYGERNVHSDSSADSESLAPPPRAKWMDKVAPIATEVLERPN